MSGSSCLERVETEGAHREHLRHLLEEYPGATTSGFNPVPGGRRSGRHPGLLRDPGGKSQRPDFDGAQGRRQYLFSEICRLLPGVGEGHSRRYCRRLDGPRYQANAKAGRTLTHWVKLRLSGHRLLLMAVPEC